MTARADSRSPDAPVGEVCCDAAWEEAYLRFETPEQEVRKFTRRLRAAGCESWPRDAAIVELFCGRGNGLVALERLGFEHLQGIDLSPTLTARYAGPAPIRIADCRALPLADRSQDFVIVHGGLHHLAELPADLEKTLSEARRVLRDGGRLVVVEPWLTPFLRFAHFLCRSPLLGRLVPKVGALATMNRHEHETYTRWLAAPRLVLATFERLFHVERRTIGWGKLRLVARPRRKTPP